VRSSGLTPPVFDSLEEFLASEEKNRHGDRRAGQRLSLV